MPLPVRRIAAAGGMLVVAGRSAAPDQGRTAAPIARPATADAPAVLATTRLRRWRTLASSLISWRLEPPTRFSPTCAAPHSRTAQPSACGRASPVPRSHAPRRAGNAVKKQQLIRRQAQRGQHFEVEFSSACRRIGDLRVEQRPPAQHSHHQFGRQPVIGGESFA